MRYRLRHLELDTDRFSLVRGGVEHPLGPIVFRALLLLARSGERVVTKEELLANVWEGARVSDAAVQQTIRKVRQALGEPGSGPVWITSVYGRGYRLEARLETIGEAPPSRELAFLARPAIAVVTFDEGDDARFALGLAEDLTHRLASFRALPVLAHATVLSWKRRGGEIGELPRLGAHFGVNLSVRRAAGRTRVGAELVNLLDGTRISGQHHESGFEDLFLAQDELAVEIAAQLVPKLMQEGGPRALRRDPTTRSAWEAYLAGLEHLWSYSAASNAAARDAFEDACGADPGFSAPRAMLALSHLNDANAGWSADARISIAKALEAGLRAVETDDDDPVAHAALAGAFAVARERGRAQAGFERALRDNPSLAWARWGFGRSLTAWGQARDGLGHLRQALRLSPEDPLRLHFHEGIALAHLALGEPHEAVEAARQSLGLQAAWPRTHHVLAAALACVGDPAAAQEALSEARRLGDRRSREAVEQSFEGWAAAPEIRGPYLEALRASRWD